jgi:hypothetical protein
MNFPLGLDAQQVPCPVSMILRTGRSAPLPEAELAVTDEATPRAATGP